MKRAVDIKHVGRLTVLPLLLAIGCSAASAQEGSFDVGMGLGFADAADFEGFDGGWDLQFGYEWRETEKWFIGAQLHVIRGWTEEEDLVGGTEMTFDSVATNVTFRPNKPWMRWIQLKAGLVYADYKTFEVDGSGVGVTAGVGVVLGGERFRVHLLDYSRYEVQGAGFNVYSINFGALFGQ